MTRNISFSMTKEQFRNRTKTVTRRIGWKHLKPSTVLCGVEKAQGLKKGEKVVKMGLIRVVNVRIEWLYELIDNLEYGKAEVIKEGFPDMTPVQFFGFFIEHNDFDYTEEKVTRIEFEYLDGVP
ncbi:MAG: hypothetical protein MUO73_09430 [Thermoplasmata archaeon]|nr:hypothetical protein [Thermoplasmata archaeon]